jgi:hypothetical protein
VSARPAVNLDRMDGRHDTKVFQPPAHRVEGGDEERLTAS